MSIRYRILTYATALLLPFSTEAVITYQTVDVPAAVGHGGSFLDGYIRGDGTDSVDPTNANGALSAALSFNLPFSSPAFVNYLSATATWDNFVVSGNTVRVRDFSFSGSDVRTNGTSFDVTNAAGASHNLTATLDGQMFIQYTADFEYTGPPIANWVGQHTEVDFLAAGGYVLNDVNTGLQTATAAQFPFLAAGQAQTAADYLNHVVDNHLANDWTQAGLWLFSGNYNAGNTRGFFKDSLIGGDFIGYSVWFSTDTFVFGQPIPDANNDGLFSNEEVEALIANGDFPELGGLNLAGDGFAQLYDVNIIEGGGAEQTLVFEYDELLLAPGQEGMLSIVHFNNGVWETPPQILDIDANTITVTVDSFSPFALVVVPLPPALALLAPALLLLRRRKSPA